MKRKAKGVTARSFKDPHLRVGDQHRQLRCCHQRRQIARTNLKLLVRDIVSGEKPSNIEPKQLGSFHPIPSMSESSYLPPTVEELLEEFQEMEDWDERYEYIVELGRELPTLASEYQDAANLVTGCMSTVWMVTQSPASAPDIINIMADSDSLIVKGLIVILLSHYSGISARQILDKDPNELFEQLGLSSHLSPQRKNGLFSMVKRLRELAAQKLVEIDQA